MYFIQEVVDKDLVMTISEWDIKETFNMETVATVYFKKTAEAILEHLNLLTDPKFKNGDLVGLAQMINNYLREWIQKYPDGGSSSYNDAVDFVIGKVMQACRGCLNPSLVRQLVLLEWKPFDGTNYFLPC